MVIHLLIILNDTGIKTGILNIDYSDSSSLQRKRIISLSQENTIIYELYDQQIPLPYVNFSGYYKLLDQTQ